jgi:5'-methylthioadenosine phosphorylase
LSTAAIGIIGGSGLYAMEGLKVLEEREIPTPFGEPSDPYVIGEIDGVRVAFLARHGRGHNKLPSELNYRANIYGFKVLGVHSILSASAVGSMKIDYEPTNIVFPLQFIDRTRHRRSRHVCGSHLRATRDSRVCRRAAVRRESA